MKVHTINGKEYRLPGNLNDFQRDLYIHLIDWKRNNGIKEAGIYRNREYDAIVPDSRANEFPTLYPGLGPTVLEHQKRFPFRLHRHFNHMASSQAANMNLFLPVVLHPRANEILGRIRSDFARLATDQLDHGYRIEYWDDPFGSLGDKTEVSGTDSDIAIAYYNHSDELCLWLIEHKLTEREFTTCGGFKSRGRRPEHDCSKSFVDLIADKNSCYVHDVRGFNYWGITEANQDFLANHAQIPHCPFQGGMNQLWRNQLLAMAVEQDDRLPYKYVSFSVVRHPRNVSLDRSIRAFKELIDDNPKFSAFTSADVISAAAAAGDDRLDEWVAWYCALYDLPVPE